MRKQARGEHPLPSTASAKALRKQHSLKGKDIFEMDGERSRRGGSRGLDHIQRLVWWALLRAMFFVG